VAKLKKKSRLHLVKQYFLPILLSALLFLLSLVTYKIILADKFYPLTFVGNTNISFLTEGQAIRKVQGNFQQRLKQKLEFHSPTAIIDLATSSATLDYSALDQDFKQSHEDSFILFRNSKINPKITFNLDQQLSVIASSVDKSPQNAQLIFDETPNSEGTPSARIQIKEGVNGQALDKTTIENLVTGYLLTGEFKPKLPIKVTEPKITTNQMVRAKQTLEAVIQEPVKLVFGENSWVLDVKQLLTLLDTTKGGDLILDQDQTLAFLGKIAQEIDREVQEGLFEFNPNTKRVTAFKPSQEGQKLDVNKTFFLINDALASASTKTITLPVEIVKPKIATSDVNSLGIKELLGRGISNFAGSIANRIYNIGLTASRINGVLVPPGEVFSFNQTIGDISAATGFKQAYVIKEGRTVLDDGGGVCQDSTTLFRAVLNAGLPVIKRTAHAYRVSYYEQGFPPGLDATVFYPSVDFQFKNDTSAHILIQAYIAGTTLYFDLYGTPDNRVVSLTKPVVSNQTPPPPELRQDDPTLPKGTVKQVDWAAWGASVSFKRTVTRNGETLIDETWRSNFKPWQAVYLVGTQ